MSAVMCMFTPRLNRPPGCLDRSANAYCRGTVGKRQRWRGLKWTTGGPSGACVSVRHLTMAPDGNNNKYMCQKGESNRAKGKMGGKRPPCVLMAVHVRAVWVNVMVKWLGLMILGIWKYIIYNSHKANQPIRYFMWFEQGHCMVKAGVSVLRKKLCDLFRYVALFRNVRQNSL